MLDFLQFTNRDSNHWKALRALGAFHCRYLYQNLSEVVTAAPGGITPGGIICSYVTRVPGNVKAFTLDIVNGTGRWQCVDENSGVIIYDEDLENAYRTFETQREAFQSHIQGDPGCSMIQRPVFPILPTDETFEDMKTIVKFRSVCKQWENLVQTLLKVRGMNQIVLWCKQTALEDKADKKRALEDSEAFVERANKRRLEKYGYTPLSNT